MKPKLSTWQDTKKSMPASIGWYEVKHKNKKGEWIENKGYALWDGSTWKRIAGWPSKGAEKAWDIINGVLFVPPHNKDLRQEVTVTQWRGLL